MKIEKKKQFLEISAEPIKLFLAHFSDAVNLELYKID